MDDISFLRVGEEVGVDENRIRRNQGGIILKEEGGRYLRTVRVGRLVHVPFQNLMRLSMESIHFSHHICGGFLFLSFLLTLGLVLL